MAVKVKGKSIFNILVWLDNNLISVLAGFLLVFIPLYPKLPLFDILPGYIVRVRLEDFFVFLTFFIWLVWVIRGKISLRDNPLLKPILLYLLVGILSMFSAVFIIKTVPLEFLHISKMVLHFIRRIEYFSLFFIFFSAIKKPKYLKTYIFITLIVALAVAIYGFGQKYLYWPAFSTMNREFSKGWVLYLTKHSRVLSTFAGHYDLAAYTMMILVFAWSLFFAFKNKLVKFFILSITGAVFWLLILTASRTSFLAYLVAVTLALFLWIFKKPFWWVFSRWLIVICLSIIVMLSFGDLSERFSKLFRLEQRLGGLKEILLHPMVRPPSERAVFLVNNLEAVSSKSDQPPLPYKPTDKPFDVYEDIPEPVVATDSGEITYRPRTYSQTALKYDLSTGIRLDVLWPRAINGFLRNPLLGSGYSTLTKTQLTEFTEAESTDNDFLRMLGETGLLGMLSFLAIIGIAVISVWQALKGVRDSFFYSIFIASIAISIGILVNAIYIDVFEASKVAYTYWALMGLVLGTISLKKQEFERNQRPLKLNLNLFLLKQDIVKTLKSEKFYLLCILFLAFYLRLYKIDQPVADWHSWRQADTAAVSRNFEKEGINLLYPTFDDLSSIPSGKPNPKGLRMVEFPLYNAFNILVKKLIPEGPLERSMRLTSIFASCFSLVFLFLLVKKYLNRRTALIVAFLFAVLPYNIYYNRVILPEPFALFLALGFLYFFDRFISLEGSDKLLFWSRLRYFLFACFFGAAALLVKPFTVFLFLPAIYLSWRYLSLSFLTTKKLYLMLFLIVLPFLLWRAWISQFPEGIPAFDWLFNGDGIRFKGAFFYWIFAERIAKLILGYWGLPFLVLGLLLKKDNKEGWLFRWLGFGSLLYLVIVATGNVRHDYYQILIIPSLLVFLAKGINYLLSFPKEFSRFVSLVFVLVGVLFMEAFGWYQVRDFFNINHPEIVRAGEAVDKLTPQKSLVIAPYNGDTAFLYQTKRGGWPIVEGSIEEMIKKGAQFYVSVNFDDLTRELIEKASLPKTGSYLDNDYSIIDQTDEYVIIQLVSKTQLPKD